jgi:hypothetical protein
MIAGITIALIALQSAQPQTREQQPVTVDWPALPALPFRAPPLVTDEMHRFVQQDVSARKCPVPASEGANQTLVAEVAVQVDAEGNVTRTLPRAIDCPTVEQYAAGLVASFARNNLAPRVGTGSVWYKASLTFSWKK